MVTMLSLLDRLMLSTVGTTPGKLMTAGSLVPFVSNRITAASLPRDGCFMVELEDLASSNGFLTDHVSSARNEVPSLLLKTKRPIAKSWNHRYRSRHHDTSEIESL